MPDTFYTRTLKSGKFTYFIDVLEAKSEKKYIRITCSKPLRDANGYSTQKFTRQSIEVFEDRMGDFMEAIQEAVKVCTGENSETTTS